MKKLTKIFGIIFAVCTVLFLGVLVTSLFKPYGFGDFLLNIYEDIFEDYGHTVDGLFNRLVFIALFSFIGSLIISLGLFIASSKLSDDTEEESTEKTNTEVNEDSTSDKTKTTSKPALKKIKSLKRNSKSTGTVIAESITEAKEAVTKTASTSIKTAESIDNFISSLRNKK